MPSSTSSITAAAVIGLVSEAIRKMEAWDIGVPLEIVKSPYRSILRPLLDYIGMGLLLPSAALVLATLVGLTTVPHLARRVVTTRLRDAVDYEVTRAGIVYAIATLLIGIAALNTGNNLLYVIVAAMLAAILVSGLASAVVLRGLELDVRLPDQVFAGRPAPAKLLLRNCRRWLH